MGAMQAPAANGIYPGTASASAGYVANGSIQKNGTNITTVATFTTGDVIGFALDLDNLTIAFYKNNTLQYTVTGLTAGTYFLGAGQYNGSTSSTNFGQRPFAYTAPSGFKALCTQNLPTPTIGATSATLANKYYDATLFTGQATNTAVVNSGGFQPDWVWMKARSITESNYLVDAVRGGNSILRSDTTAAELTISGFLTFNSNGFTPSSASAVTVGATYVGWQWKANGTGSSNTAGSITSTVSANTTSGFSIVTYTGTRTSAGNDSIGHGLGVAPSLVISKSRSDSSRWVVQHISLGSDDYLELNTTSSFSDSVAVGAGSLPKPTSTVFYGSWLQGLNISGQTFVAYCFAPIAGYSAFGSYTGNGSTDGPFVFTGFRPAYLMFKRTDSTSGWTIYDASRDPYNYARNRLYANSSNAESSGANYTDLLSNGFKVRDTDIWGNASGGTYIYMAFASSPFKYSLAR
jgi:hypothetical protein